MSARAVEQLRAILREALKLDDDQLQHLTVMIFFKVVTMGFAVGMLLGVLSGGAACIWGMHVR